MGYVAKNYIGAKSGRYFIEFFPLGDGKGLVIDIMDSKGNESLGTTWNQDEGKAMLQQLAKGLGYKSGEWVEIE